jgi:REP element-mobilizing transposase RayT
LIQIGGIEDHIHLLVNLAPSKAVSDVLRDIKANSAKWVNEEHLSTEKFEWQKGYGAFTVSYSNIDTVQVYIQNQQEHHRSRSFRDEYIEFLKRHGIEFEEQFLFESEHTG